MTKLRYKNSDNNNNNNNNNEQDNDNNDDDGSSLLTKVKKEALPAEGDIPILSKINGNNKEHHNNQHRNSNNNNKKLRGKDAFDYVMTGATREKMEQDKALHSVTSEARVWKMFRQKEALRNPSIPVDVVLERTTDTFEDVMGHMSRMSYENGMQELTFSQEQSRKTVVVLGSGWAAHALMKVADCKKLRIIVVSPTNHFVFTPMLASASVGTVEYRSMTEAVRAANPMIHDYIEGKAVDINVKDKKVKVQLNELVTATTTTDEKGEKEKPWFLDISYDHLVVSVGSRVNDMGVPGAQQHALRLKTTEDARQLRTAVGEAFEYAMRPGLTEEEKCRRVTFLIAGGGPTGVELAGELSDLFDDITRKHKGTYPKLAGKARVILAHGGSDLVPQFEEPLRQKALDSLRTKGVEVYLNTRVNEVTSKSATLSVKKFDPVTGELLKERDEFDIPIGLSVWCAGTAPANFCQKLLENLPEEARHPSGRINVDGWMRPVMDDPALFGSIMVLGDAAAQEKSYWEPELLPSTAQVAGQQGAYVARMLSRNFNMTDPVPTLIPIDENKNDDNEDDVFYDPALYNWLRFRGLEKSPPFTFLNLGLLAYVGGNEALTQVQIGDKKVVSKAGSVGFFLWRSVYLVKQVATRNRVLVTFDWIKSAMFGRDTTRF